MKDGTQVTIRQIHPEDEPLMVKFHGTLSDRTVYLRYFCSMSLAHRTTHERLVRICFGDEREMVRWRNTEIRKRVNYAYWAWVGSISCRRIKKQK
jgi:hypothetical protein